MQLLMYLNNDCIDSVPIDKSCITLPGYMGHFIKMLRQKHERLLLRSGGEPEFLVYSFPVKGLSVTHSPCQESPMQSPVLKKAI